MCENVKLKDLLRAYLLRSPHPASKGFYSEFLSIFEKKNSEKKIDRYIPVKNTKITPK